MIDPGMPTLWEPSVVNPTRDDSDRRQLGYLPSSETLQSIYTFGAVLPTAVSESWAHKPGLLHAPSAIINHSRDAVRSAVLPSGAPRLREHAVGLLDAELRRSVPPETKPIVLFSGGVDSSLLAARLVALGRDDVRLIHYQFRDDDPETEIARCVAQELGLALTVVRRSRDGIKCLDNPGAVYPVPFGDHSTAPTRELCDALPEHVAPDSRLVVLDGTGADGAFGLGQKVAHLQALQQIPPTALRAASRIYAAGMWRSKGSPEYRLRVLRRANALTPALAVVAQNSLFDILYRAPALPDMNTEWDDLTQSVVGNALERRIVFTDLAVTCARIFAQKTYGPLRSLGYDVSYPFLSPSLAALGIAATRSDPGAVPKRWMREELSRHVSNRLIDRPKSGFIDPAMPLFREPAFREAINDALQPDAVGADLLLHKQIRSLLRRRPDLSGLPHGHLNALWAFAFVDRWFRTWTGPQHETSST